MRALTRRMLFSRTIAFGCSMEAIGLLLVKVVTADTQTRWDKRGPTHAVTKTTLERHT